MGTLANLDGALAFERVVLPGEELEPPLILGPVDDPLTLFLFFLFPRCCLLLLVGELGREMEDGGSMDAKDPRPS
jgi:hypothetical protein